MGGSGYAGGWYLYASDPYGRLPELEGISGPRLIQIPMLLRPLLGACLQNMWSAQNS